MRLLIIEDNADIVANLFGYFEPLGHVLDTAANGYAGLALAAQHEYDAIVLDLSLPGLDGLALCRRLRDELQLAVPVLMLTARDTLDDKVAGFESGADDYLLKPFALVELDMRLQALVRRSHGTRARVGRLQVGDLVFDTATYEVHRGDRAIELTPTGYKLLACLMRAAPQVVSRATLEAEVWGDDQPDSDALRTHIHALRQAIDRGESTPMLRTVQSVGYRLVDDNDTAR